jgi:hypothetical protein
MNTVEPRSGASSPDRQASSNDQATTKPNEGQPGGLTPKRVFAGVGAAVALLVGVSQLISWIEDRTRDTPPPKVDARITSAGMLKRVPLGNFLREEGQSNAGFDKDELATPGNVVSVRVRIQGFKDERLPLRWSMYNADTETELRGEWSDRLGITFRPAGQDEAGRGRFWVGIPARDGTFFVRLTLRDDKGEVRDEKRLAPFDVAPL